MEAIARGRLPAALLALYGWRRVMLACVRYVADLTQVRAVLKSICARYKARWGDDAFVRSRKQPFTTAHLTAIVALLEAANQLVTWTAVLRQAVLTAFCNALSTGARKDEWTASFEGDTFVRRGNFNWVDGDGNDLPNTPATVAARKNGDLLRGRQAIFHTGDDSWNVMGQQLRGHNNFWGWEDNEYSECRVVGFAGENTFASGKPSKHRYIIEYDGYFYPETHTTVKTVAGALTDAAVKRRIKKAPAPRLL